MRSAQSQVDAPERQMLVDDLARPNETQVENSGAEAAAGLVFRPGLATPNQVGSSIRRIVRSLAPSAGLEADRGAVFLLAPVMLCVGSLAYFASPFEPGWPLLLAIAAFGVLLARWCREQQALGPLALLVALSCAGLLLAKFEMWRSATRVIGGEISTRVTGRVELIEPRENGRARLTLAVLDTERPKLRYQPDRVRLTARTIPSDIRAGSVITGVARLTQPLGPLRPGAYDFAFENYFDQIGATGFFLRDPEISPRWHDAPSRIDRLSNTVENARGQLAQRVRDRIGGDEGEIAAALIAGVRAGIPEHTNEVLRITGLAHVLSISGLHMALVAGVVIGAMRAGFALFPAFASNYPVRKFAAGGALVVLAAYLLISGAAVAAQRSFLMIAVMLAALLFDRSAVTMRNLAIAALVILIVAPHEAAGPSFQMSFAATAALIAAYGWWQNKNSGGRPVLHQRPGIAIRLSRTVLLYAAGLAATALVAGSATGIFGAWHFQRVSPLGVPANLLTMPIVSVMVMPFAVIGVLAIPFGLDGPAFWVMGKGLEWMIAIAAWLARLTPFDAIGAIPIAAVIMLALALIPLTLATTVLWRIAALPLLVLGIVLLATRQLPLALGSEDARLVAVRLEDGQIAVNRDRPNPFILKDWKRAMKAGAVAKPAKAAADGDLFSGDGRFLCRDGLCVSSGPSVSIAHARDMKRAEVACSNVRIIIIEDATAANPCPFSKTKVITAKQFALRGSAEIKRAGEIVFALPETARPWHDHRRFSRAARAMPPYVSKARPASIRPASKISNQTSPPANAPEHKIQ